MTKQREAFEKWAKIRCPNHYLMYFQCNQSGRYHYGSTQFAFESWQAAQADKLEFARKVGDLSFQSGFYAADCNDYMSLDGIIAKVEQEQ